MKTTKGINFNTRAAKAARVLWGLLDDIDTLSDATKGDLEAFYKRTMALVAQRHEVMTSDGYRLYWPKCVLWRMSDGSLIDVGDTSGPSSLYVRQREMSDTGDKDTACASLAYIKKSGFDVDRFVDPDETEYRMEARETLRGDVE